MLREPHGAPRTSDSLAEYGRGLGGGFLFSLPLLLTMEVWATGFAVSPARLLVGLAATYVLLCGFNAFAGLRFDANMGEVMVDSVEELGIGLTISAVLLALFGRFSYVNGIEDYAGPIVLEGLFVAVGVSVGTAQLSATGEEPRGTPQGRHETLWSEIVLACCGAVLVAANAAPTDEILHVAAEMQPWQALAIVAISLLLAGTLLYFSQFVGSARFGEAPGPLSVAHGTAITYVTALATAAALLWFFGRLDNHALTVNLTQIVVLGLVATLGAAAGRLLLR